MRIRHLVWLLLSLVASSASAQTLQRCDTTAGVTIVANKPTVYISFDEVNDSGPATSRLASAGQPSEKLQQQPKERGNQGAFIWLRLHNNTRWAISVPTDSLYVGPVVSPITLCAGRSVLAIRDGRKINVRYELELPSRPESIDGKHRHELPTLNRSDVSSTTWLPPGGSVLFSVPREYLGRSSSGIYVPYEYEWEYDDRRFRTNEPEHRVYFRTFNLPKELQSRIQ